MKYMGNYSSVLTPSTIFDFITKPGERRPNEKMSEYYSKNIHNDAVFNDWMNAGYFESNTIEWFMYYKTDLTELLDLDKIDFLKEYSEYRWWAVKVMPGKCFPGHIDRYQDQGNVTRFWMAVEDYHWGHIFIHGDQMLHGYKSGDIFEMPDFIHGAGNIGLFPKLSIQIVAKK